MNPGDEAWAYKILRRDEWLAFRRDGVFAGSADDLRDGFIHLSTGQQVEGTLAKYFPGEPEVVILRIATAPLAGDLRWEPSRGGALFPHLYRPLRLAEVEVSAAP